MLNFIKKERKRQGMSIAKLSELSGIKSRTIENWEYCGVVPPLDKFLKVLDALDYEVIIAKKKQGVEK